MLVHSFSPNTKAFKKIQFLCSLKSVALADPSLTEALYGLGLVYSKLKRNSQAEKHYLQVLELEPLHVEAMLDLAYLHYTEQNFTEVIRLLQRIPRSMLFTTAEYVQLGSMLVNSHIQLDHLNEAEELFKMMLVQDSQKLQVDALNGLGKTASDVAYTILCVSLYYQPCAG